MGVKLQQAFEAYEKERPELLRQHQGRWAGFWGHQCIGPFDNASDVYAYARNQSAPEDELLVRHIDSAPDDAAIECRFVTLDGEYV